jgi:hypothetical protein
LATAGAAKPRDMTAPTAPTRTFPIMVASVHSAFT